MSSDFNIYTFRRIDREEEDSRSKRGRKKRARVGLPRVNVLAVFNNPLLRAAGGKVREAVTGALSLAAIPHLLIQFVLARAVLLGELMPLGTAYLAAALVYRPAMGWGMVLALAAGARYSTLPGEALPLGLMALTIMWTVASSRTKPERWWLALPFLVLSVHLLVRNGVLIYNGWNLFREFAIIFEAVIAAVLSFIFLVALGRLGRQGHETRIEEAIAGAILGICIVIGISDINLGEWSISAVIGGLVVLLAAQIGGAGAGAAGGALLGLLPSVTHMITPYAVGIYALAGLLAGLFRRWGRVGTVLGFALGYLLLTIYIVDGVPGRDLLINTGSSALLFLLTPSRLFDYLGAQVKSGTAVDKAGEPAAGGSDYPVWWKSVNQRLLHLTNLMGEVSAALEEKSGVPAEEEDQLPELIENVRQGLCKGCARHNACWQEEFYTTYRNLLDMIALIESQGELEGEEYAIPLKKHCMRSRELTALLQQAVEAHRKKSYWKERYREGREIVSHQVRGVAEVLRDTLEELENRVVRQTDMEKAIVDELRAIRVKARDIQVYQLPSQDIEVHLRRRGCPNQGDCVNRLVPALSRRLGRRLEMLGQECSWPAPDCCEVTLAPAKELALKVGVSQVAKPGAPCSGDSVLTEELSGGRFLLALSDGMGAGTKASRISKQTLGLLQQLLETRIDLKHAVHSLNTLMRLRSVEEDFATLDLALVSLRDGETSIIKLGAPPSVLKREKKAKLISGGSPPVGILDRLDMNETEIKLQPGDLLVMVSDGVLDSHFHAAEREAWLLGLVKGLEVNDPQEMADQILVQAVAKGGRRKDDMAVVVARVEPVEEGQRVVA